MEAVPRATTRRPSVSPEPLVYTSRRQNKQFNGNFDILGEPANILLHPQTAAEHGIVDGQNVKVTHQGRSDHADRQGRRRGCMKGVGSISHGHAEGNVNELTSRFDIDPLGGMAHYSAVPIEIEPATTPVADRPLALQD